jgi:RNA polymerase sigma-70 factor (ECF subfamily)
MATLTENDLDKSVSNQFTSIDDLIVTIHRCDNADENGGDDAMAEIVHRFQAYLTLIADQNLSQGIRAKFGVSDIVQQSFLDVQQSLDSFQGQSEAELRTWLKQILLNNIRDGARFYRRQTRSMEREISIDSQAFLPLPSRFESPSWCLRRDEQDDELIREIERLPDRQQSVILARHRDRKSYSDIAATMGMTEAVARQLWSRGIARLRSVLSQTS